MINAERLQMEIGINIPAEELSVYLAEEGLNATDEYIPHSPSNKRKIYQAALSILNSVANNPQNMKAYKHDDLTITDFAKSIQNRIEQLERKIRMMSATDEQEGNSSVFMLFNS